MTGGPIWYELRTSDNQKAAAFYGAVVGWSVGENAMPGGAMDYRVIARGDGGHAGGMLQLTDAMTAGGAKTGWFAYFHVADVDATAALMLADGASLLMPANTMDGVGRMALLADPLAAPFYVMTPQQPADRPDARSDVFSVDRPQHVRWHELVTPDDDRAVAFYTRHLGWEQENAMPMGELGDYRFIERAGVTIGAVMKQAPFMTPGWCFYFGIPDIDVAVAAVHEAGGTTASDPQEIPGGEFSVHCRDPQGGWFGLVGPRRV